MSNKLNIIDFDETLYKHDSLIRFCLFIYKKRPKQIINVFEQAFAFFLHSFKIIDTKIYKQMFLSFAKGINENDLIELSIEFWNNEYPHSFNNEILKSIEKSERTICISASPEIYLKYICDKLNIELIGTILEFKDAKYYIVGENCKGQEKLKRLIKYMNNQDFIIDSSYSDSMTDLPIFNKSNNAYLVKENSITKL